MRKKKSNPMQLLANHAEEIAAMNTPKPAVRSATCAMLRCESIRIIGTLEDVPAV